MAVDDDDLGGATGQCDGSMAMVLEPTQQEEGDVPEFPSGVELVTVGVVVTDSEVGQLLADVTNRPLEHPADQIEKIFEPETP